VIQWSGKFDGVIFVPERRKYIGLRYILLRQVSCNWHAFAPALGPAWGSGTREKSLFGPDRQERYHSRKWMAFSH
jgi:hypothetical protein